MAVALVRLASVLLAGCSVASRPQAAVSVVWPAEQRAQEQVAAPLVLLAAGSVLLAVIVRVLAETQLKFAQVALAPAQVPVKAQALLAK